MEDFKNGAISEADLDKIAGGFNSDEALGKVASSLHIDKETLATGLKATGAIVVSAAALTGAYQLGKRSGRNEQLTYRPGEDIPPPPPEGYIGIYHPQAGKKKN